MYIVENHWKLAKKLKNYIKNWKIVIKNHKKIWKNWSKIKKNRKSYGKFVEKLTEMCNKCSKLPNITKKEELRENWPKIVKNTQKSEKIKMKYDKKIV